MRKSIYVLRLKCTLVLVITYKVITLHHSNFRQLKHRHSSGAGLPPSFSALGLTTLGLVATGAAMTGAASGASSGAAVKPGRVCIKTRNYDRTLLDKSSIVRLSV